MQCLKSGCSGSGTTTPEKASGQCASVGFVTGEKAKKYQSS